MMSCREIARQVSGLGLRELGWSDRLRVRVHFLVCRPCRSYARQVRILRAAVREIHRNDVGDVDLERLEESILRSISSSPDP